MVTNSLVKTLDEINEAWFYNRELAKTEIEKTIKEICKRQIKSGKNVGMIFVPENNYTKGLQLFTGEKLKTKLATRNIVGQEAARILRIFNILSDEVQDVLTKANKWMLKSCYAADYCFKGECAHSSIGFMRYLTVAGIKDTEQRLNKYIEQIRKRRDGKSKWKGLPFHYTLLTLLEVDTPSAIDELGYALPAIEKSLKRIGDSDKFSQRRRDVMKRILEKLRDQNFLQSSHQMSLKEWIEH